MILHLRARAGGRAFLIEADAVLDVRVPEGADDAIALWRGRPLPRLRFALALDPAAPRCPDTAIELLCRGASREPELVLEMDENDGAVRLAPAVLAALPPISDAAERRFDALALLDPPLGPTLRIAPSRLAAALRRGEPA